MSGLPDRPDGTEPRDLPLAVVDIDGVVADVRHRLRHVRRTPRDWDAFFAAAVHDPPHPEGVAVVERLADDHEVVFLTGRPEWLRADTRAWLARHGLDGHRLLMRPERDRRPAAQVKLRLLRELARGRTVAVVVDDDADVVAALAAAGYPTLHATWETDARSDGATRALRTAQEVEGRT
jgi:phosphoglycolate phosphatase-like HAD superfamily hydrolase